MVDVKKEEETDESQMQYRYKTGSTDEQEENDDSLSKYMKETEEEPNNASAHNNLGVALFNLGRHAESVKSFDRAIALNPSEGTYYYNRGLAHYNLDQVDEALSDFNKAIRISPGEANYHYNKAILLHDIGRTEDSLKEFNEAIKLNPRDPDYYNDRANVLSELGKFEQALQDYKDAIDLNPRDPGYHDNKGTALFNAGRVERFGVKLLPRKNRKHRRMIGTLGPWHPDWVRNTVPQAGQMGFQQRTAYNLRVLKVGPKTEVESVNPKGGFVGYGLVRNDYVLLHGSVPGPSKRLIKLRDAARQRVSTAEKITLSYISVESKQGD